MSLGNLAAEYYGGKVIHVPLVAASTTQMDIITFTYSYVTDNLHVFLIKMNKNNILKSNIKFVEKNCPPSENENKCIVNTKMILKSCTYKYVASTIDGMPGIDGTECEVDEFYFSLR